MRILKPTFFLIVIFSFWGATVSRAQKLTAKDYIEKFKEDAIKEMYLHHIPASIVLAQAMFESANGNSELALFANNHFGIKCKKEWCGESYLKDDEEDKECFRKYDNVLASYSDHSLFLINRPRYAPLFELPINDYKAWCYGLKDAGYATDPKYARRLIDIIEKFKLYEYDRYQEVEKPEFPGTKHEIPSLVLREVYRFNHIKFVITKEGDSYFKIASQFNLELERLLEYNDIQKGEKIRVGQKIFLENKRSKAKEPYHVVQEGEDLRAISQIHGLKLAILCKNNRLSPEDDLKTGEILYLRGKKPVRLADLLPEKEIIPVETASKN
jgi:LysM repeat protein